MYNLRPRNKRKRGSSPDLTGTATIVKKRPPKKAVRAQGSTSGASLAGRSSTSRGAEDVFLLEAGDARTQPAVVATIENTKIKANRDVKLYIVGGNLTEGPPVLKELRSLLEPVVAAYDSYTSSKNQRSRCFEGTRVQLISDIKSWSIGDDGRAPVYVLDGVAGIGKSTIAQTIAELAAQDGILGASFFFSRDEDHRKTARRFFPTLAFHLARYNEAFASRINEALQENPDAANRTLQQQISLLIVEPLQDLLSQPRPPILVVVDALDECDDQEAKTLLTLLAQHIQTMPQLRFFVTARPELHIRDVLDQDHNHERFHLHEIDDMIVQSDIRLFLNFCLSAEQVQKLLPRLNPPWQPTDQDMRILHGVCGKLFIIASTAAKFILDSKRSDPERQLARLLEGVSPVDFTGSGKTDAMDRFYIQILRSALPEDHDNLDDEWFRRYQVVLGAVIVLQNPLPCKALATLLDVDANYIEGALEHLHSLIAPSGPELIFRVHHKSFPDFITSEIRISRSLAIGKIPEDGLETGLRLRIDAATHHSEMAKLCLRIMVRLLKQNLRELGPEHWYMDDANIKHSQEQTIAEELAYACKHWASHLHAGELEDPETRDLLHEWGTHHLFAWLELLNSLNRLDAAYSSLEKARRTLVEASHWVEKDILQEIINDAYRFVQQNDAVIRFSSMHMYWSAIPFIPADTALARLNVGIDGLRVVSGIGKAWDPTITTLSDHKGWVNSVVYSNDGSKLVSASHDHTVRMWDGVTGTLITTLEGHRDLVTALAFSNNGLRLASASDDCTARIWDGITGTHIATLHHSSRVTSVAFSFDGLKLASSSAQTVQLWNGKTGASLNTIDCHSNVDSLAFSSDGSRFALASHDDMGHSIRLYQWSGVAATLITTTKMHTDRVPFIIFSADCSNLASASHDGTVQVWNGRTGGHIRTLQTEDCADQVNCVAFSKCNTTLASGCDDSGIYLWDNRTGAYITTLRGHSECVTSVAYSVDNTRLASGSGDCTVRIWDTQNNDPSQILYHHSGMVTSVAFSGDGSKLASASYDRKIRVWHGRTGAHIRTLETGDESEGDPITSVTFSDDGLMLAWAVADGHAYLWDACTYEHIHTFSGSEEAVNSITFSKNGSTLATGGDDGVVRIWSSQTGDCLNSLEFHDAQVTSVAFSPDDSRLASASYDLTIRLYNTRGFEDVTTLRGHNKWVTSIAFSPNGLNLASVSIDNTIKIWDVVAEACVYQYSNDSHTLLSPRFNMRASTPDLNIFILVERCEPSLSGLVSASLRQMANSSGGRCHRERSHVEVDSESVTQWDEVPFCWFPPDCDVCTFAVNGTHLAIGCANGRVILLDISRVPLSLG